mgnify:CR=1 FL=1
MHKAYESSDMVQGRAYMIDPITEVCETRLITSSRIRTLGSLNVMPYFIKPELFVELCMSSFLKIPCDLLNLMNHLDLSP